MEPSPEVLVEQRGATLEVSFNRPDRKNAINLAMYRSLTAALLRAKQDATTRSVLIYGQGGIFTSGNDLNDFANASNLQDENNPIVIFMQALLSFPKPVVVAVEGVAVGIGTTLLLHCDLAYGHTDARFVLPFVKLGLCPEYASSYLIPRIAGAAKASEWLLLGEEFSAQEAKEGNLINSVEAAPLAKARAACDKFALLPPAAVRQSKALLKQTTSDNVQRVIDTEIALFAKALSQPEFAEAVGAFFEKRKPDFSHFE